MNHINESLAHVTIKLNDVCNTSCLHCVSHGKSENVFDFEKAQPGLVALLDHLFAKGIRVYEIAVIGGEITRIEPSVLESTVTQLIACLDRFRLARSEAQISVSIISNFIFSHRSPYLDLLSSFAATPLLDVSIYTSFDRGLGRFKSAAAEGAWRTNCEAFKGSLRLLVTLNTETVDYLPEIIGGDPFFGRFDTICFQYLRAIYAKEKLPNATLSYPRLYSTIQTLRAKASSGGPQQLLFGDGIKERYHITINDDGMVSASFSEEASLYRDRPHFSIDALPSHLTDLDSMISSQLFKRIRQTRNPTCLTCDEFQGCNFGFEAFDTPCPATRMVPSENGALCS